MLLMLANKTLLFCFAPYLPLSQWNSHLLLPGAANTDSQELYLLLNYQLTSFYKAACFRLTAIS